MKPHDTFILWKGHGRMNRRAAIENVSDYKAVDTEKLQGLLMAGRRTAIKIGTEAGARIQVGKRVLWNVSKVQKYLDQISE